MKRRPAIGLGITALVLSILFGIASLPDEVLIESSTVENSQTLPDDMPFVPTIEDVSDLVPESVPKKNTDNTNVELNALKNELDQLKKEIKQLKTVSDIPEEISQVSETEDEQLQEPTGSNVITVSISDGVGTTER